MHRLGLFSCLCLTATSSAATAGGAPPGPAPDYLRRHAETRGFTLGRPQRPRPTPDGKAVLFLRSGATSPELHLYEFDVASAQTRELLTPGQLLQGAAEQLSAEERARRERMRQSHSGFTWFELSKDGRLILLSLSGRLYTVERPAGRVQELRAGGRAVEGVLDPQLAPDGHAVAYVRERDLYVLDLRSHAERRLTHSEHPGVTFGQAEFVAQEEMRRYSGFFWAPDSRRIAVEEVDNREVETLYITDPLHPERAPARFSYPRPGKDNARVRLWVASLGQEPLVPVRWDSGRFPYLATVRWSERAPLTLVVQSRDQRDLQVLAVDEGGATRPLHSEHDDAWLNLDQEVPRWLDSGAGFLWTSERSGGRELELRGPDGALVRTLVGRDEGYIGLLDVDEAGGSLVYAASRDTAQRALYQRPLGGGAAVPLTPTAGHHAATFGRDHHLYVQVSSTLEHMPRALVLRLAGGAPQLLGELPSVAESPPHLPQVELTEVGPRRLRAALVRPRGAQAGRKYPVIVDVYGGPGHLHVTATRARWLQAQWLADHGFIVVALDNRGTPGRGRDFERALKGSFAGVTLQDQAEGLRALGAAHPELDLQRVGIVGWSFGGYMAALAVTRQPDLYKVGVAGAPVVDWQDYDTHYTERYLGLPQEAPAAYQESSLLKDPGALRRPLLIIHGTADDNVYFFHSLKLSQALFRAGRAHEFLPLSGLTHMVPDPNVHVRLWERILGTLSAALRPGP